MSQLLGWGSRRVGMMLGLQFSCLPWVAWWPWWSLWWLVGPPSCPLPAVWNRKLVNKMSYWIRNIDHLSFLIPSHRVLIQSLKRVKTFVRTVERRKHRRKSNKERNWNWCYNALDEQETFSWVTRVCVKQIETELVMKERNVHMDGEGWHATTCYDDIGCVSLLDTDILISELQMAVSRTGQSFLNTV